MQSYLSTCFDPFSFELGYKAVYILCRHYYRKLKVFERDGLEEQGEEKKGLD